MINEDKTCLKYRNQTTREEEYYSKVYTKRFSGYLFYMFFCHQAIGYMLLMAIVAAFYPMTLLLPKGGIIPWAICMSVSSIIYVSHILFYLWSWKYSKYVVITNEGIWKMSYSFIKYTNFKGKKYLLNAHWSIYDWTEIQLSPKIPNPSINNKLDNFEYIMQNWDYKILKATRLSSLLISRWDGKEKIDFLKKDDVDEIMSYYRLQKRASRSCEDNDK